MYQISDGLSKTIGSHNFKVGIAWEWGQKVETSGGNSQGTYNFNGADDPFFQSNTLDGFANAYLGNFKTYTEGQRVLGLKSSVGLEAFVQDSWRVHRRLTLDLGVRFSPSEREAIAHLWRWIGYVMGVPEDLLPVSARQAEEHVDAALPHGGTPTEDSPRLMHALLYHGLNIGPASPLAAQLVGALSRRWMGHEMADRLEVPGARLSRLVPLMRPVTRARDVVRATGLLGSDRRVAELELALVGRTLALRRAPQAPLDPSTAEAELTA